MEALCCRNVAAVAAQSMPLAADIVKSGALRLLGSARRPAPSLFSLPGLEARANWRGAKGLDAAPICSSL